MILLSTSEKYTSTILCMILLQRPRHSQPDPGSNLWIISNHKRSYFITGTTVISFKWLQTSVEQECHGSLKYSVESTVLISLLVNTIHHQQ